ncbi:hypothetical protein NQ315_006967 [Exocentrus adspersus]|uniref:Uncharacterized protein n=1 Tax=Exocentrus adspersus TaxID=1586481 RepID=A0AAV8WEQ1_9CUCU|nr:hypothetical protein NQ315_006967 [Exocentrus adspersus]
MTESKHFHTLLLFLASASCEYTSNVIDMDDILAEDFMPGTLLVLENPTAGFKSFNESIKNLQVMERTPDGSFGNAMETMNFHRMKIPVFSRSKMNEYLCRNFVAEQIVSDMTTSRIRRRMGHVTPGDEDGIPNKPSQFKPASTKNSLMSDEGSSNYKDWLSKSTTLEDIYRHYDQAQNRIDGDIIEEEEKGEDFDEEYAGYVYPNPHEGHTPAKHRGHTGLGMYYGGGGGGYPYPNAVYHQGGGQGDYHGGGSGYHYSSGGSGGHHGGDHYSSGGGGDYSDHVTGGGGGGGGHHHPVVETIYSTPPKYHGEASYGEGNKDHDLSDLFDIALTALAFLSFGLFVVHVIMCISAASQQSTTTTMTSLMMPMSLSPTAPEPGDTGTGNNGGGGMTSDGGGDTATGGGGTGGGMTATATGTGGGGAESTGNSDTGTGGGDIDDGGGASPMGDGDMGDGGGGTGSASPTGDGDMGDGGGGRRWRYR